MMWTRWVSGLTVLAEDERTPSGMSAMLLMFAPVIAVMLLLQVFASRSQQKTEQNRLKKLRELKKNDPIVTLSGIYGTFISITEDGREVTMKVDENCRLRVRSESIRELPVASPKT